jgi:hypothetical protein
MHLMVHEYAKGGRTALETSDDGGELLGELDGNRQVGERICAYVDAACDSTEEGYDRLLEAINWLTQEINRRKGSTAAKAAG